MPEELIPNNNSPSHYELLAENIAKVSLASFVLSGVAEVVEAHQLSRDALGTALGAYIIAIGIPAIDRGWGRLEPAVERFQGWYRAKIDKHRSNS